MKKHLQTGITSRISWIILGFLIISCNGTPNQATAPVVLPSSIPIATSTQQQLVHSTTPLISLNLAGGDSLQRGLNAALWLPNGKLALSGANGVSLYQGLQAGLRAQSAPSFQTQAAAENPTLLTAAADGSGLTWVSGQRKIMFWDTTQSDAVSMIVESDSPVTGLALEPDQTELVYSNLNGSLIFQDIGSHEITRKWELTSWLNNLSFSPDGQYLAGTTLSDFKVTIYSQTGEVIKQLEWGDAVHPALSGAFFSPNWQKVAWVSRSAVQLMDVATGEQTVLLNHEDAVGTIAWASDNHLLATSSILSQNGTVTAAVFVWNADTGLLSAILPMPTPVQSITFAPDAKSLAVLDVTGEVRIWSLEAQNE